MRQLTLHEQPGLRVLMLARDPERSPEVIDTNEYLLVTAGGAVLLDPGGTEVFPAVVAAVAEVIDVTTLATFVCSHQDPDVMSSLPLWMGLCPEARIHLPWLWAGFIAHFGHEYVPRFVKVPDEGCAIPLGGGLDDLRLVPAHYCHSSGNFSVYDPNSRTLFSGDLGAALLPDDDATLVVEDFAAHVPRMELFHRRWMPSNRAKRRWIERVRQLEVQRICPQHGAVFEGADVARFLDWLEALEVGSAID